MTNKLMLGTLVGMLALTACGDKTDAAGSSSASAKPAGTTTASGSAKKEEPAAAKPLTVAQFTTDAPAAACKAIVSCKNEEVSVSLGAGMMLIAGFAGMEDPKLGADMKAIGEAMKKDNNRQLMNGEECTKVMGGLTGATGFTAAKLQASIDAKKVDFNGEKAAACVATLSSEPSFCKEAKKVTGEPKLDEIDKWMKGYEKDFDAHVKVCNEAVVGKVAVGEACEYDFECAGEDTGCKGKKCVAKKK